MAISAANAPIRPETYGAVANAHYRNEATGVLYADAALTVPATDDLAALHAARDAAILTGQVLALAGNYRVSSTCDLRGVRRLSADRSVLRADDLFARFALLAGADDMDWTGSLAVELWDDRAVRGYFQSTGTPGCAQFNEASGRIAGFTGYGGRYTQAARCHNLVFDRPRAFRSTNSAFMAYESRGVTFDHPYVRDSSTGLRTERSEDVTFTKIDVRHMHSNAWRLEDSHRCRILGGVIEEAAPGSFYMPQSPADPLPWGDALDYARQDHLVSDVVVINGHRPVLPLPYSHGYTQHNMGYVATCSGGGRGTLRRVHAVSTDPAPNQVHDFRDAGLVLNPDSITTISVTQEEANAIPSHETIEAGVSTVRVVPAGGEEAFRPGSYTLFYANLAAPLDLRATKTLAVDLYRSYRAYTGHLLCRIYSSADRTAFLGEFTFGTSSVFEQTAMTMIPFGHISDADVSRVRCVEFVYQGAASTGGATATELKALTFSMLQDRPRPIAAFLGQKLGKGEDLALEDCTARGFDRRTLSLYRRKVGFPVIRDLARE